MNRTPPTEVLRILRKEVGFGCPIPDCGNPYLTWHHFDPPWHVQEHHNPNGMIALCSEHAAKADAGAYTNEQLLDFKQKPMPKEIRGKFEWMRHSLVTVIGSNFCDSMVVLMVNGKRRIWFNRDEDGYLLLNIQMLTRSREPRMEIKDNFWIERGSPYELISPPSGKLVSVSYTNGDTLKVEFFNIESLDNFRKRYPEARCLLPLPITAVEVYENVADTKINFGPKETKLGATIRNGYFRAAVAIAINSSGISAAIGVHNPVFSDL